jgi:hypothetical protein
LGTSNAAALGWVEPIIAGGGGETHPIDAAAASPDAPEVIEDTSISMNLSRRGYS